MPEVQDQAALEDADDAPTSSYDWVVRGVYAFLIGANLWLAYDWWRGTEQGHRTIDRVRAFGAECEGCAKRKAMLQRATARMHREARQVVEGADTTSDVQPEPPGP